MLKDIFNSLKKQFKIWPNISCISVTAIVLAIDYFTGRVIRFPIIYVLPVSMSAWQEQKSMAYAIAIIMPLARVAFHIPWNQVESISVAVLNAFISVLGLTFYAYLVYRIAWQTRALKTKVRVLEGILPVCASCKRIRTEQGEFELIEKYITEHSEASFSHTICPECTKKLYPELFNDEKE